MEKSHLERKAAMLDKLSELLAPEKNPADYTLKELDEPNANRDGTPLPRISANEPIKDQKGHNQVDPDSEEVRKGHNKELRRIVRGY